MGMENVVWAREHHMQNVTSPRTHLGKPQVLVILNSWGSWNHNTIVQDSMEIRLNKIGGLDSKLLSRVQMLVYLTLDGIERVKRRLF